MELYSSYAPPSELNDRRDWYVRACQYFWAMGSSRNPRRNIVLAVLVISLSLGICYVKLKYFRRPREELYSNREWRKFNKHHDIISPYPAPSPISPLSLESGNIKTTTLVTETDNQDHTPSLSSPPNIAIDPNQPIHVVLSVDRVDFVGVPTLLNSLSKHSSNNVIVHIIVTGDKNQLKSLIDCCKLDKNIEVIKVIILINY